MADFGRLLVDRFAAAIPVGAGASNSDETSLDPVNDAVNQLAALTSFFAVLNAGGNPTASQLASAQAALGAIGADLRALQTRPAPPPGAKVWVSAPAALGVAAGAGVLGGVVGWLVRGASEEGKR